MKKKEFRGCLTQNIFSFFSLLISLSWRAASVGGESYDERRVGMGDNRKLMPGVSKNYCSQFFLILCSFSNAGYGNRENCYTIKNSGVRGGGEEGEWGSQNRHNAAVPLFRNLTS